MCVSHSTVNSFISLGLSLQTWFWNSEIFRLFWNSFLFRDFARHQFRRSSKLQFRASIGYLESCPSKCIEFIKPFYLSRAWKGTKFNFWKRARCPKQVCLLSYKLFTLRFYQWENNRNLFSSRCTKEVCILTYKLFTFKFYNYQ